MTIKIDSIIPNNKYVIQWAKQVMKEKVSAIRDGKVVRHMYKPLTSKKRKQHGLQTSHIDLTGNNTYSRHNWRLLDTWKIIAINRLQAKVVWARDAAAVIYGNLMRKFGDIFT